jgi:hypothetical protein
LSYSPTEQGNTGQLCSQSGQRRMERLWSLAIATSGNRWQMGSLPNPQNHRKTVAVGCGRLLGPAGKEGVDGSSPSEGLLFSLLSRRFCADAGLTFRRPRDVHACPRLARRALRASRTLMGVLAPVARELAAVAVDHRQAGAHVAGDVEAVRPRGCRGGSQRRERAAPGRRSARCEEARSIGRLIAATGWLHARGSATSRGRRRSR